MVINKEIQRKFARASRRTSHKAGLITPDTFEYIRSHSGAKVFKRKIMGLCGKKAIKSLDEIAMVLTDMGVTDNLHEGLEMAEELRDYSLYYGPKQRIYFENLSSTSRKLRLEIRDQRIKYGDSPF